MQKIKFKLKQGQKVQTDRKTSRQIRTQKAEKNIETKKQETENKQTEKQPHRDTIKDIFFMY